jgi:excisionase family DNA binding protein
MDSGRLPAGTALTVDQAASMGRVSALDVLRAIDSRRLRAKQVRGEWQILVEDVRRWIAHR